jgi:hypothetical protein
MYFLRYFIFKHLKFFLFSDILLISPFFCITLEVSLLKADNSRLLHILPTMRWGFHKLASFPSSAVEGIDVGSPLYHKISQQQTMADVISSVLQSPNKAYCLICIKQE